MARAVRTAFRNAVEGPRTVTDTWAGRVRTSTPGAAWTVAIPISIELLLATGLTCIFTVTPFVLALTPRGSPILTRRVSVPAPCPETEIGTVATDAILLSAPGDPEVFMLEGTMVMPDTPKPALGSPRTDAITGTVFRVERDWTGIVTCTLEGRIAT